MMMMMMMMMIMMIMMMMMRKGETALTDVAMVTRKERKGKNKERIPAAVIVRMKIQVTRERDVVEVIFVI